MEQQRTTGVEPAHDQRAAVGVMVGRPVQMSAIVAAVGQFYDVTVGQIESKRRYYRWAWARQVCMYIARRHTHLSLEEIAAKLGRSDHSTVIHAVKKVAATLSRDAVLARLIGELESGLCTRANEELPR